MKRIVLFCAALAAIVACNKEKYPIKIKSICHVTDEIREHFDTSVYHLYVQDVRSSASNANYGVKTIDSVDLEPYFEKLAAIYTASSQSDDINRFLFAYGVQANAGYSLEDLIVSFNDAAMMDSVINYPGATGEAVLDNLVTTEGFSISETYPSLNAILFTSNGRKNIEAYCDELEDLTSVAYADPDTLFNVRSNIEYSENADVHEFIFKLGWGTCGTECDKWHNWTVEVDSLCDVTLTGESGDPIAF